MVILLAGLLWLPTRGNSSENLRAEAEASGSHKPIKLTLRLLKRKIRLRDKEDKWPESPWFQIELKNIGKKKIEIDPDFFQFPGTIELKKLERQWPTGIYLEVRGPDGKLVQARRTEILFHCLPEEAQKGLLSWGEKVQATVREGERKGLSWEEIDKKILKMKNDSSAPPDETPPAAWLLPGASTTTVGWAARGQCDEKNGIPPPRPIGNFTELDNLWIYQLGKYRIRAGYDEQLSKASIKQYHLIPDEWDVSVETPFIEFEVVP